MTLPSGAIFYNVALEQVDAKSPVDDTLMTSIAEDLYWLKARANTINKGIFEYKVNGRISVIGEAGVLPMRRLDGGYLTAAQTFSRYAVYLDKPGVSGTLEIDVRAYQDPLTPITEIAEIYSQSIQSIVRAGSGFPTQSITRATSQVATQSISYFKAATNVQTVVPLADGNTRYNLDTTPDGDYQVGDSVVIAGCTSGANNGTFQIVEVNPDGYPALTLDNTSGVAQAAAAGTAQLQMFQYIAINPLSTIGFVVGENAQFSGHTAGANDGTFELFYVNQAANNLVIKNPVGVVQAGVAGFMDTLRWKYNLATPATASDIIVGETANFTGHTSGANDGNFEVLLIDSGGNNVVIHNDSGVAQGGVAGTTQSNRWIYALPTDPSTQFVVTESFVASSTTNPANSGLFVIVQVNRSATNNLVIHNESGVTQLGAAGTLKHLKKLIKFSSDQSAIYTTSSRIEITETANVANEGEFEVKQVNRGGGSNFNVVIENQFAVIQQGAAGRINVESKSLFSTRPSITRLEKIQYATNGVFGPGAVVADNMTVALDVIDVPTGNARDLTVYVG